MKKIILILFILSLQAYAEEKKDEIKEDDSKKTQLIILGGGGEPAGKKSTQFDGSVRMLSTFLNENKGVYKTTINFNGGHSETEKLIKNGFKESEIVENFTKENYKKIVDNAIETLSKTPEGGQMMIFINTHGSEKEEGLKTHKIATSEGAMTDMNSGGTAMVSMDSLAELAKLAKEKKVRLAIFDGSCHSGNSMVLANENTCVISASGPKHYAYSDFPDMFAARMFKGKNLEAIFNETRRESGGKGFPMISSPEGKIVQDKLYPLLTPYLYSHSEEANGVVLDKLDRYMRDSLGKSDQIMCQREIDFNGLTKVLELIDSLAAIKNPEGSFSNLKEKIAAYKKNQDEYFNKLAALDMAKIDTEEVILAEYGNDKGNKYTHRMLISTNFLNLIQDKEKALEKENLDEKEKIELERTRDFFKAAEIVKERVLKENSQYEESQNIIKGLKDDKDVGSAIASDIAKAAQSAYDSYYKSMQQEHMKSENPAPNPCKDFVL